LFASRDNGGGGRILLLLLPPQAFRDVRDG
jgi:hypothetical protein